MVVMRHCATCDEVHPKGTLCPIARATTQRVQDQRRGSAQQRGYDAAWQRVSAAVIERDGGVCQLRRWCCTVRATTSDHVVPLSRGGARLDPDNLVAACRECNSAKRDR